MDLFEIDLFIDAISKYLKMNRPFTILTDKQGLSWEPRHSTNLARDLQSIEIFSDYLISNLGHLDFRELPEDYFYKIRALVHLLNDFIKSKKKKYGGEGINVFHEAELKMLALKLGGRVDYRSIETMDSDFYQFLIINQLDEKLFALGIQLSDLNSFPFEVDANDFRSLRWKDLKKIALEDESGRMFGYRFFYEDRLVMETNVNLLLTDDFTLTYKGLMYYHPSRALHIAALDKRESRVNQKNKIEIVSLSKKGKFFLVMKSEDGSVYCIGIKKGKIVAPIDLFYQTYFCKYELEVSKLEFMKIFEYLERLKYYKTDVSEFFLFEMLQEKLYLKDLPQKKITSGKKILSYLLMPIGILKFLLARDSYPLFNLSDVILRPYLVSRLDSRKFHIWLEEVSYERNGEGRCFE
jgi:hypothetical protein